MFWVRLPIALARSVEDAGEQTEAAQPPSPQAILRATSSGLRGPRATRAGECECFAARSWRPSPMERPVSPEDHPAHPRRPRPYMTRWVGSRLVDDRGGRSDESIARRRSGPMCSERVRARDPEALAAFFERYFDHGVRTRVPIARRSRRGGGRDAGGISQGASRSPDGSTRRATRRRGSPPSLYNACRDVWRSGAYRMAPAERFDRRGRPTWRIACRVARVIPESLVLSREREAPRARRDRSAARAPARGGAALRIPGVEPPADRRRARHPPRGRARKRYSRALEVLGRLLRETLGR